jgi:hypothetical protein
LARWNGSNSSGTPSRFHDGTGIGHHEHRVLPVQSGVDGQPPLSDVVPHRVLDQIGGQPVEQGTVAGGGGGVQGGPHGEPTRGDLAGQGVQRVLSGGGQVDRFRLRGEVLAPGQREQPVDQPLRPVDGAVHVAGHPLELRRRAVDLDPWSGSCLPPNRRAAGCGDIDQLRRES